MPQVFISYSRKDLVFVERLVSDLKSAGLAVWYDLSGLDGGTQWGTEIQRAIKKSQYFLLVVSPNSLESKWVQREFLYAESIDLKVIPLFYLPCDLPMWLLDLQMIDLQSKNYESNFDRVLKALGVQTLAERSQALEAAETITRLEAEEKERIAREEQQKQLDDEEQRRKMAEKKALEVMEKTRLENEAKERHEKEEQYRQQKANAKAHRQLEKQQRRTQQKAKIIILWKKWRPGVIRLGGFGALIVLIIIIGINLLPGGIGSSPQPTSTIRNFETKIPVPSPTFTITSTNSLEPSNTPLPVSTLESSFILSINEYISQTSPTFEDDFSTENQEWGYSKELFIPDWIQNGQLSFEKRDVSNHISFPNNGLFRAEDFVLQYDYFYTGWNTFGVEFHAPPEEIGSRSYFEFSISYYPDSKTWNLFDRDILLSPGEQLLLSGKVNSQIGLNNLRIFCRKNHLVVFFNDIKIIDKDDLKSLEGSNNLIFTSGTISSTFDNVKFWNLDGVDFSQ